MTNEEIELEYKNRINSLTLIVEKLKSREKKIAGYRLLTFFATLLLFYLLLSANLGISIFFLVTGLGFLGYLMNLNLHITRERQFNQHLLSINEKEMSCILGNFHFFPNGAEYTEKEHPYTSDLDIFGESSLFQYLNRTTSSPGSKMLAQWLKAPSQKEEIIIRQDAVVELSQKLTWRQQLMALGYQYATSAADSENILKWTQEASKVNNRKYMLLLANIFSFLIFADITATFFGLPIGVLLLHVIVNYYIANSMKEAINNIHRSITGTVEMLTSYSQTIALIETESFQSEKLRKLQLLFKHNKDSASEQIQQLSGLVHKLDYRLNLLVGIPFNILFFWDIRQIFALERWKKRNQEYIPLWFDGLAEFEAITSLSNASYNNPDWVIPEIAPTHFQFKAIDLGHPLIPAAKRVTNSLEINQNGKIILITGSNMSGKSTFLRTCGVNVVLAMSGAPVCARHFAISRNIVYTSMRISDSLEENTSSFYAELKRLAMIIQAAEKQEDIFLLLDEILRGTNSNDRHIGSVALIHQLLKSKASGIIATHDLDLSKLENELTGQLENYNFDVKIENDELYFDYKLNAGICKSLNASILMRKMGLRV